MIRGKMSELGSKQLRDLGIKQSNLNIILKALGGRGGLGRFKESRFMIRFVFWGRLIWQVVWRQMGEPEALQALLIIEGV